MQSMLDQIRGEEMAFSAVKSKFWRKMNEYTDNFNIIGETKVSP